MKLSRLHPRDSILKCMDRIYQNAMTTTSGGNISILDSQDRCWITPSRKDKGTLTRDDIVSVLGDGSVEGPLPPSSELPFHQAIYKVRPDIRCVIHAHPPSLVSFSMIGKVPNTKITPKCWRICGEPKIAPYALPGSTQLGESIATQFATSTDVRAVILENHGVVVGAGNIEEAFKLFETLDFAARAQVKASALGDIKALTHMEARHMPQSYQFMEHEPNEEELELRYQIIQFNQRAYRQRLFTSTEGIIAVRHGKGLIIPPQFSDRYLMDEEDLVYVEGNAHETAKSPSKSTRLHQAIFERNPDVGAIIIAAPPNALAFSITGTRLNTRTIPEAWLLLQDPGLIPIELMYDGGQAVAERIAKGEPVLLAENDSVVAVGKDLLEAFDRLEVLEYSAKAIVDSQRLGDIQPIANEAIGELKDAFLS